MFLSAPWNKNLSSKRVFITFSGDFLTQRNNEAKKSSLGNFAAWISASYCGCHLMRPQSRPRIKMSAASSFHKTSNNFKKWKSTNIGDVPLVPKNWICKRLFIDFALDVWQKLSNSQINISCTIYALGWVSAHFEQWRLLLVFHCLTVCFAGDLWGPTINRNGFHCRCTLVTCTADVFTLFIHQEALTQEKTTIDSRSAAMLVAVGSILLGSICGFVASSGSAVVHPTLMTRNIEKTIENEKDQKKRVLVASLFSVQTVGMSARIARVRARRSPHKVQVGHCRENGRLMSFDRRTGLVLVNRSKAASMRVIDVALKMSPASLRGEPLKIGQR